MFKFDYSTDYKFLQKQRLDVHLVRNVDKIYVDRIKPQFFSEFAIIKIGFDVLVETVDTRAKSEAPIKTVVNVVIKVVPKIIAKYDISGNYIIFEQQAFMRQVT